MARVRGSRISVGVHNGGYILVPVVIAGVVALRAVVSTMALELVSFRVNI